MDNTVSTSTIWFARKNIQKDRHGFNKFTSFYVVILET